MRKFNNSICTSDDIRKIKRQRKNFANNPKISSEYDKVVEDTKIAIENLTEYINNPELLNQLLLKIQEEDSTFLVGALGLTKRGNNDSYYRGYLALDARNVVEFRAADHYETESVAKDKTNNKAQYLFQLVMITNPPKQQSDNAITGTGRVANINVITRTITSESTIDELILLLKAIRDYLKTPSTSYDSQLAIGDDSPNSKTEINCSKKLNSNNTIRLTESDLKNIIKGTVMKILKEGFSN